MYVLHATYSKYSISVVYAQLTLNYFLELTEFDVLSTEFDVLTIIFSSSSALHLSGISSILYLCILVRGLTLLTNFFVLL